MKLFRPFLCLLLVFCSLIYCSPSNSQVVPRKGVVNGLSFVAPPQPFTSNPFSDIQNISANFIAVIPYAFMRKDDPMVHYNPQGKQWWGERPEGVIETIKQAHAHNIEVMLKPSVYMHGTWTGDVAFSQIEQNKIWEETYSTYILSFAEMADSLGVKIFCIGNEFKQLTLKRPQFWKNLISDIRCIYHGKLTYAANWDEYSTVSFWEELDYIGINAYFPLSEDKNPTLNKLMKAWKPLAKEIRACSQKNLTPVLFTEFGYLSLEGATHNTWELENNRDESEISEEVQSKAYEALFRTFWPTDYWHGGFVWKWYPYESRRSHRRIRDYTPQGKLGHKTLNSWYTKDL